MNPKEILSIRADESRRRADDTNMRTRDALAMAVGALGITPMGKTPVTTPSRPSMLLGVGNHQGIPITDWTTILGVPGATMGRIEVDAVGVIITGIRFEADQSPVLVDVTLTASVVFNHCQFIRTANAPAGSHVLVAAGGRAVFNGCCFLGTGGTNVVSNAGAMADVRVIGSLNETGLAHVNVTEV